MKKNNKKINQTEQFRSPSYMLGTLQTERRRGFSRGPALEEDNMRDIIFH